MVNGQLGRDSTIAAIDTLAEPPGALLVAVNSCIRKLAAHMGIIGHDTLTISSGTFLYELNANFMEDEIQSKKIKGFAVDSTTNTIYQLLRGSVGEISNFVEAPGIIKFDLTGDRLWLNNDNLIAGPLYIEGPVAGLTMTDGADTTNVHDQDRSAVCDCATALMGYQLVGVDGPTTVPDSWWDKFTAYVVARGGTVPTLAGP